MTPHRKTRNHAVPVLQRLLDLARDDRVDYNLVLQRCAAERFLYRLSVSSEVDRFRLKGAALFRVWTKEDLRPPRDVDFLAVGLEDDSAIRTFQRPSATYRAPRTALSSTRRRSGSTPFGTSSCTAVCECGSGAGWPKLGSPSKSTSALATSSRPGARKQDYPTLLDLPAPRLWTYPHERFIAEKLEAMVRLGATSSRVKDLWDVACVAQCFGFDGKTLRTAIEETFGRRRMLLAGNRPVPLLPGYYEDTIRAQRWHQLQRQVGTGPDGPTRLVDAGEELRRYLRPVCDSLIEESPFTQAWAPGGPWRPGTQVRTGGEGRD